MKTITLKFTQIKPKNQLKLYKKKKNLNKQILK